MSHSYRQQHPLLKTYTTVYVSYLAFKPIRHLDKLELALTQSTSARVSCSISPAAIRHPVLATPYDLQLVIPKPFFPKPDQIPRVRWTMRTIHRTGQTNARCQQHGAQRQSQCPPRGRTAPRPSHLSGSGSLHLRRDDRSCPCELRQPH